MFDLAPNARVRRPSGPSGPFVPGSRLRLVWSQPYRRSERRPRHLMLIAVLCFFLAGLVATGGLDRPFFFRAVLAALIVSGALLFVLGLALLTLQKGRRTQGARLAVAGSSRPLFERFQQEERR